MPCHTRMKRIMRGLLWLFLLEYGCLTVMSLEPGYLDFDNLPDTNFSCVGKVIGGYYADLETNCQMFHVCTIGQLDEPMDIRFLCLNGTVFDQETRVCERIDEVDCSKSEQFYSLNLELYGNTQPPILEEEFPVEIKRSSSTTTTTTTTTQRPSRSSSQPYYTTSVPPTTTRTGTKVITSHHFPVVNSPDIRFNPEEINISLNPGAPPDITRSQVPISFQQQSYSNSERNTKVTVTTHTTIYKNDKPHRVPLLPTLNTPSQIFVEHEHVDRPKLEETTQAPKSVVSYGLTHNQGLQAATPTEINYEFTYQQTEESLDYNTEVPPHPYQYQLSIANLRPPTAQEHPYHSLYQTTSRRPHKVNFPVPTTYRNHPAYTSVRTSSSQQFDSQRTEKPPRLQLPLPLLPTLPPLTFSSPAPFSLGRHIETKRFTNDHQSPPRIIISASASVSDNSGRRLNYSLGTIGASHLLGPSPATYDEYKEDDVGLDPFYHDVPKIKSLRHKRNALREEDVIKNDQEAADLLRFLFNWYSKREKTRKISIPVASEDITEINEELAPIAEVTSSAEEDYSNLFDKTNKENVTETKIENNLETAGSTNQEIEFFNKNNKDLELEDLAKMLEILNETYKPLSEPLYESKKETKYTEIILLDSNTAPLNQTGVHENIEQAPALNVTTQKPKQGRSNRRRTGSSRTTTPRRTKKPKSQRNTNNRRISNSPRGLQDPDLKSQVDEPKNVRRNSSRFGRPRKVNSAIENEKVLKHNLQVPADIGKDEKNGSFQLTQSLDGEKFPETTNLETEKVLTDTGFNHTILGNNSVHTEDVEKYEHIKQEDLSKIYKLLGEKEPVNSLPQLSATNTESEAEDVETHESKQLEHVITTHENLEFIQAEIFTSTESENLNSETTTHGHENTSTDSVVSENTTLDNVGFESTTVENITNETTEKEKSENLNDKEHSSEVVQKKQIQEDKEVTSNPEYVSTTVQPNHENLEAQPSSYRNEENHHDPENKELEHNDHPDSVSSEVDVDLISQTESTSDKSNQESDNGDYENETESHTYIETSTEYSKKEHYEDLNNIHRTDKTLEEQELEEATLHVDLLNSENNPESNNGEEFPDRNFGSLTGELNKITEISGIDTTTLEPGSQKSIEEYTDDKSRNIALTSRHRSKERIVFPRNNLKTANRRTFETPSIGEEFPSNPKLSAISHYKSKEEGQKRRNNYIRSRKFISNQTSSKNIENPEIVKAQNKDKAENYEKSKEKEETSEIIKTDPEEDNQENSVTTENNPIVPDYVDDNYEPLTYHDSPKLKEFENIITTTYKDENFDENTVTDDNLRLNNLEHSTDFGAISDLHDHTSPKSSEDEEVLNTTTTSKDNSENHEEINKNQEEEIGTTPITEDDHVASTTEANYELLTEATTSIVSIEHLTTENNLKYDEDQTTESPTTHYTTQSSDVTTFPTTTEVVNNSETTREPAIATTIPEATTSLPISEYVQTTNANTESTIDLLQVSVFTTDYPTTTNLETTQATSVAPSSSSDSSRRITTLTEPEVEVDFTTPMGDGTTNKYQHLKTRLPWYKRQNNDRRKEHSKHRFTTNTRRLGTTGSIRERSKLENKITHVLNNFNRSNSKSHNSADKLLVDRNRNVNHNNTTKLSDTESLVNSITTNTNNSNNNILEPQVNLTETKIVEPHLEVETVNVTKVATEKILKVTTIKIEDLVETTITPEELPPTTMPTELERSNSGEIKVDIPVTDAPLLKSANPTKAKYTKIAFTTTPLSKFVRVELRKDMHGRRYSFNCFNKKIHQFYSDARDCRLFHYCTMGYSKNQMVDMKFVCDAGTYFDEEKLICTKVKPARCL